MTLQPADGKILIGGSFTTVAGQTRHFLARLNTDGTLDTTFQNPNINGIGVNVIFVQPDGKILIGGDFRSVGGQERNNIARLNADGSLDASFNPNTDNDVLAMALQPADGKILIGGTFNAVGGQARHFLARLNTDGTLDTTFPNPNVGNTNSNTTTRISEIILQPDDKILIGGTFNAVGGQTRSAVARLNTDGTLDTAFQNPNIGNGANVSVFSLALQPADGKILIGGSFASVGGQERNNIARLNADGTLDTSFANPSVVNGFVRKLLLRSDRKVLIGGDFDAVGGQVRNRLARLNSDGTLDTSFPDPNISGGFIVTMALQPADGKILIGGTFTSVNGRRRVIITRLMANGSLDVPAPMTFTVTKTADTNDGACDADCSLREAVTAANNSESEDTIEFTPNLFNNPQIITLTGGQLPICNTGSLIINGRSASLLTISGNNQTRVFRLFVGVTATFNNLKIANGNTNVGNFSGCNLDGFNNASVGGGGIENQGTLFINNSIISDNLAVGSGGGIANVYGTLTIANSIIENNRAGDAGGISNIGLSGSGIASLTLVNSTVRDNTAPFELGNGAGGIGNYSGATLTLNSSTVYRNTTAAFGGGIRNIEATVVSNNSTISNNTAKNGGGIANTGGTLNLSNTTIAFNQGSSSGGGVYSGSFSNFPSVTNARNTLIGNNSSSSAPDFFGTLISQGYNLIKNTSGTVITGITTGNILNVDPLLDSMLRDNGGATGTHALELNSPALDKGNRFGSTTDQRGFTRPVDFPSVSNSVGGDGSDIGAFERQMQTRATLFDFDGDGKADISVFRPSTGGWYILQSSNNSFFGLGFGVSNDIIAPADFDGDGKTDFAVFRPDSGSWYLQQSISGFTGVQFGQNGDIPVPADYDGDGKADIAVFRPSTGGWYRLNSSNGQFVAVAFGTAEDKPTIGDFDGDGKADIAVFRPSTANWFRLNSSNNQFVAVPFGAAEDKLTPADFDGDGKTDIAVFRPSTGGWYRLNSSNGEFVAVGFGTAEDKPVAADYDGDGKADIAVFRPSTANWYLLRSTAGFTAVQFGTSEDKPTPNAFVP